MKQRKTSYWKSQPCLSCKRTTGGGLFCCDGCRCNYYGIVPLTIEQVPPIELRRSAPQPTSGEVIDDVRDESKLIAPERQLAEDAVYPDEPRARLDHGSPGRRLS